jgi:hypothetical protein
LIVQNYAEKGADEKNTVPNVAQAIKATAILKPSSNQPTA